MPAWAAIFWTAPSDRSSSMSVCPKYHQNNAQKKESSPEHRCQETQGLKLKQIFARLTLK